MFPLLEMRETMRSGETGRESSHNSRLLVEKRSKRRSPITTLLPPRTRKKAIAALKHVPSRPPSTVTVRCCRDGNSHKLASRATPSPLAKKTPKSTSSSSSKSTTTKKMAAPEPNLKHQIHSLRHVLIPGLSIH